MKVRDNKFYSQFTHMQAEWFDPLTFFKSSLWILVYMYTFIGHGKAHCWRKVWNLVSDEIFYSFFSKTFNEDIFFRASLVAMLTSFPAHISRFWKNVQLYPSRVLKSRMTGNNGIVSLLMNRKWQLLNIHILVCQLYLWHDEICCKREIKHFIC